MSTPDQLKTRQVKLQLSQALGRKLVPSKNPIDKELVDLRTKAKTDVLLVLEDQMAEGIKKHLSFLEASAYLKEVGIDLEKAKMEAAKQHGRWGLVKALQKRGVINNNSEYPALFDNVQFTSKGIHELIMRQEAGETWMPIFDAGAMTPDEMFTVLFTESRIPYDADSFKNLSQLRRIDPKDIPDLVNLNAKTHVEQLDAFLSAYKKAAPLEPTGARVLFTSDKSEVTRTNTTATQEMQAFAKGEMAFVDPNADIIRFRTKMDAGLRKIAGRQGNFDGMTDEAYRAFLDNAFADKAIDEYMPNRESVTSYPNYAFEDSWIPAFYFDIHDRKVYINIYHPDDYDIYLGSRISLG